MSRPRSRRRGRIPSCISHSAPTGPRSGRLYPLWTTTGATSAGCGGRSHGVPGGTDGSAGCSTLAPYGGAETSNDGETNVRKGKGNEATSEPPRGHHVQAVRDRSDAGRSVPWLGRPRQLAGKHLDRREPVFSVVGRR